MMIIALLPLPSFDNVPVTVLRFRNGGRREMLGHIVPDDLRDVTDIVWTDAATLAALPGTLAAPAPRVERFGQAPKTDARVFTPTLPGEDFDGWLMRDAQNQQNPGRAAAPRVERARAAMAEVTARPTLADLAEQALASPTETETAGTFPAAFFRD